MKTIIYCKPTEKGVHSFYISNNGETYFLFSQAYRKSVQEYFSKGVILDKAIKFSKTHNDSAIIKTKTKLPMYIKYAEKEYDLYLLNHHNKGVA